MGTARLVNRTAKTASPLRIMHTDTIIERHPVINRRPVILTLQDRIFLLICQRIRACRVPQPFARFPDTKSDSTTSFPSLIEKRCCPVRLIIHISVAVVICPMARRLLGILRLTRRTLARGNNRCQRFRLCRLVDLPAIRSAAYLNRGTIRCFQCFRFV